MMPCEYPPPGGGAPSVWISVLVIVATSFRYGWCEG
jgi:hypothetical protein